MRLNNNKVLITGGSMGIGLALAKRFKTLGNQIIITGRNEETLQQIGEEFGFEYISGDTQSNSKDRSWNSRRDS